ncbi:MAG: hypothetical protein IH991_04845 [Planctomycetes bacterium]|nr:hypothetical protein [Planctomycetota bacterium]
MARKIYGITAESERDAKKKTLAKILSVSERTIRDWLSRIDKDAKEARKRKIFDLWMACHTQQEIAEAVGCDQRSLSFTDFGNIANLSKTDQASAEHATDFDIPIYNIWKQQTKTTRATELRSNAVAGFGVESHERMRQRVREVANL